MLSYVLGAAGTGFIASVAVVAVARNWAQHRMVLDHPNDRSLHVRPTPRGGGIGIVIPVCLAIASVGVLVPESRTAALRLIGIGALIAVVGLVDDVRGLPPLVRLSAQICAGILVVTGIGALRAVVWPRVASFDLGLAAIPFTVLLVVGLTNAYNFMDGVDGIAGGQAVVAGIGWTSAGYVLQDPLVTVTGTTISAASFGFLLFNWAPASVFMGDVGSSFLGFLLAALIVYAARESALTAAAGALFVWPFVFDATFTFIRRAIRRENVLHAHRSHLYQRLVLTGVPHAIVALLYAGLAAVGVLVGNVVVRGAAPASVAGVWLISALAGSLCLGVAWRERSVLRKD